VVNSGKSSCHEGGCSHPGDIVQLEMAPPEPRLTILQIQCIRQIGTDTAQSSESRVFSDTVQSSELVPCASLPAYTCSVSFLAETTTWNATYSTMCPFCSTLMNVGMV